jgi:hypothetical protein
MSETITSETAQAKLFADIPGMESVRVMVTLRSGKLIRVHEVIVWRSERVSIAQHQWVTDGEPSETERLFEVTLWGVDMVDVPDAMTSLNRADAKEREITLSRALHTINAIRDGWRR